MSDVDTAARVESADLRQMTEMDIDDVYTLMDVQLRDRPGPRDLYRRWERQNWSAYDIDFAKDKQDWASLPDMLKTEVMGIFYGFFLGEAVVTDTLAPLVLGAPTDEDRQFLSTQLVDEARHTVFFERFFDEVVGVSGLKEARERARGYGLVRQEWGYGRIFYVDLPDVTDTLRQDPSDYGKFLDAIVMYHMLIEGMLALQGQKQILQGARAFNMLPGFRAGFTAVTRDESRHVNYGVWALAEGVQAGYHDRIVEFTSKHLNDVCDVGSRDEVEVPDMDDGALNMLRSMAGDGADALEAAFFDQGKFPIMQLTKRLRSAGISEEALQTLEAQWFGRREENFANYEAKFGKPHPVVARAQAQSA